MSGMCRIDSLFDFPSLPSVPVPKSRKQPSLASVIDSSFSRWNLKTSSTLIQRTINVIEINDSYDSDDDNDFLAPTDASGDSVDSQATTRLSETTEVTSLFGSEAGYDGDEDWEVDDSDDDLTKRAQDLADEYYRKSDFRVQVKK